MLCYTHIVVFRHITNMHTHTAPPLPPGSSNTSSSNTCEILLYNRQLVVITYELIYIVQATYHCGEFIVKRTCPFCDLFFIFYGKKLQLWWSQRWLVRQVSTRC